MQQYISEVSGQPDFTFESERPESYDWTTTDTISSTLPVKANEGLNCFKDPDYETEKEDSAFEKPSETENTKETPIIGCSPQPNDVLTKKQFKASSSTSTSKKPKLPKRIESSEEILDLSGLKTLGTYNENLLSASKVCRNDLAMLHHVFRHSRRLVVITGAGISVAAGIPDFRSKTGLFKLLKNDLKLKASGKQMFDASVVYNDLDSTHNFHSTMRKLHKLCSTSQPTPFHKCINHISQDNRLLRLYTQNIDCLDTSLSHLATKTPLEAPWPQTVQLHGTIKYMNCAKCNWTSEFDPSLFTDCEEVPECPGCLEVNCERTQAGKRQQGVGRLRPKIVLYNEFNPDAELIGQITEGDLACKPDGLIVVGTSLKIPGVRRMVREMSQAVHAAKGATVWMNIDDPPQISKREFEGCFDLIVKGDCQILPQLLDDYEQELAKISELKVKERKAKIEARDAAKILRQQQILEREERKKRIAEGKVTKKSIITKASRTVSENVVAKSKPTVPKVKARKMQTISTMEFTLSQKENSGLSSSKNSSTSTTSTSSSSSSSEYGHTDSSRDSSPVLQLFGKDLSKHDLTVAIQLPSKVSTTATFLPLEAYRIKSEWVNGAPQKTRKLGVLKKKVVNTSQPTRTSTDDARLPLMMNSAVTL